MTVLHPLADGEVPIVALAKALALEVEPPGHLVHFLPLLVVEASGEDQVVWTAAAHPLLNDLDDLLLEIFTRALVSQPLPIKS